MITKICTKCGIEKDFNLFHKAKSKIDGRRNECKECATKYHTKYYLNNKDVIKNKRLEWKNKHLNNIKTNNAKYYQNNKHSIKIKQSKWVKNNPHKIAKFSKNRQAKRRGWKTPLPINKYFEGSHLHHLHINKNHQMCIYIPSELHKSIWHAYNRPETMIAINLKVIQWYYGLTIQW